VYRRAGTLNKGRKSIIAANPAAAPLRKSALYLGESPDQNGNTTIQLGEPGMMKIDNSVSNDCILAQDTLNVNDAKTAGVNR
jgi:hypothetical protein